jgi:hypothetical protein
MRNNAEQESLRDLLENCEKEDLIFFIEKLVEQQPDLVPTLKILFASPGKSRTRKKHLAVKTELYRRQVETLFRRDVYKWGAYYEIAKDLRTIKAIGDDYRDQQDYTNATAIYAVIVMTVLDHFMLHLDATGKLSGVLLECMNLLGEALEREKEDTATRETALQALARMYAYFRLNNYYDAVAEIPDMVLLSTPPEERPKVAAWLREYLQGDNKDSEVEDVFLFDLEADTFDDEVYLRTYREQGRPERVIERLLIRQRLDEAFQEAEQAPVAIDMFLIIADTFVKYGYDTQAERLVRKRFVKKQPEQALEWLKGYYETHHNPENALQCADLLFSAQQTFARFKEIQRFAEPLGRWMSLKQELLARLNADPSRYASLLLEIALDNGQVELALELLTKWRTQPTVQSLELRVAEEAEEAHPRAAIEIYQRHAENWIAERGRSSYAEAARLLTKMRRLYGKLDQSATWTKYITLLRETYRKLSALQDELSKAGL